MPVSALARHSGTPPRRRRPSPLASRICLRRMRPSTAGAPYQPAWSSTSSAGYSPWQPAVAFARSQGGAFAGPPQARWQAGGRPMGVPPSSPTPSWQPVGSAYASSTQAGASATSPAMPSPGGTRQAPGWQALVSRPPQASPAAPLPGPKPAWPSAAGMEPVPQAPTALSTGGSSYQRQMAAYRQCIAAAQQAEAQAAAAAAGAEPAAGEAAADAALAVEAAAAAEPPPVAEATLAELPAGSSQARGCKRHPAAPAEIGGGSGGSAGAMPVEVSSGAAQPQRPVAAGVNSQPAISSATALQPAAVTAAAHAPLPPPAPGFQASPNMRSIRLAAERIASCAAAIAEADRQSAALLAGLGLAAACTGLAVGGEGGASPAGGALRAREAAVAAALQRGIQHSS